jgi:hypothetical protein
MSLFASALAVVFSSVAFATPTPQSNPYFAIKSVEVQQVAEGELSSMQIMSNEQADQKTACAEQRSPSQFQGWGLSAPLDTFSDVVNIGLKLWQLVVDNKPVVNAKWASASALPGAAACWSQLQNWQTPKFKEYHVKYKNFLFMPVVDFTFRLIYTYGGSFDNKGHYLSSVQIIPGDLSVLWGYTFESNVSVPNVVNTSSHDDPMAGLEIHVDWIVKTPLQYQEKTMSYFVRGDGAVTELQ